MRSRKHSSKGFTLITSLILLCLLSALAIGLLMMVNTEAKVGAQDVQNNYTFHAAEGGIENMTAQLATELQASLSPTAAEIQALATTPGPPSIPGITFPNPGAAAPNGGYTYSPILCQGANNPAPNCTNSNVGALAILQSTVSSGPYAGLNALISQVQLQATAQGLLGDEVSMSRTVEIALIPVFQFGMFSDSDLSFYAGPNFGFGGRVHTNGDLYLSEGAGDTLTFQDKISAYGNVIRTQLANGVVLGTNGDTHTGTVMIPTQSAGCAGAQPGCSSFTSNPNDGSVTGGPTSAQNGNWSTISTGAPGAGGFNSFIIDGDYGNRNFGTGATNLTLPFVGGVTGVVGVGQPQQYEIIRRPPAGESTTSPLGASRLYNEAQIRILLSDNPNELPCGNPSTPPPCGGSSDAQNVRLANMKDPDNSLDYSHGVSQTSRAKLSDGGYQTMYFATANSAIPGSQYWSSTATTLAPDWPWGPIYSTSSSTIQYPTLWDPNNDTVTSGQAPYMIEDTGSGNGYGMLTSPMPAYLVQCQPPSGVTVVNNVYATTAANPPSCPDTGSYPYYSIYGWAVGQSASDPALALPFAYTSSQTSPTPSTVTVKDLPASGNQSSWNLVDGYLRVEYEDAGGLYHPVTQEWLQLGFARSLRPETTPGNDPIGPTSILIFQQPADRNGDGTADSVGAAPSFSVSTSSSGGHHPVTTYTYTMSNGKPPEVVADSSTGSPYFGDSLQAGGMNANLAASPSPSEYNWYPINFYDAREGEARGTVFNDNSCTPNGVMNAVELDVGNLKRWLAGSIGTSGASVNSAAQNGYILYFSDRRGMLPNPNGSPLAGTANTKTGDSGFEDVVNSGSATGTPDGVLDPNSPGKAFSSEDVNLNGALDNWGAYNLALDLGYNYFLPIPATGVAGGQSYTTSTVANTAIYKYVNPGGTGGVPDPYVIGSGVGDGNRIISCSVATNAWISGARHVLKLVDGQLGNVPLAPGNTGGFTVGSENPVYIFGDYNSNAGDTTWNNGGTGANEAGEAAAGIVADSITLLSDNWNDWTSFQLPTTVSNRTAANTAYRVAVAGGKNINFTYPATCTTAVCSTDFGTDGGVHNFLRYVENWGCCTLSYKGSIASLYYATYNTGLYKSNNVYSAPTRNFYFDTNFNSLSGLPPGTPMFRDIDNLSFTQSFTPCTLGANNRCSN
jgi:hypothetical protein